MSVTDLRPRTVTTTGPVTGRPRRGDRGRRLHIGGVSLRWRPRVVVVAAALVVACLATATWSLVLGDFPVPVADVLATTFGGGTGEFDFVVRTLRLPRTVTAALVGVALACSGALYQSLVRNPLASPDLIGITSGAGVAAVAVIVTGVPLALVPVAAFLGSLATAALIYVLAWRRGINGQRLVLVGIGVQAVLVAGTQFLLVRYPIQQVSQAYQWLTGSLYARTWTDVVTVGVGLLVLLPALVLGMRAVRALQLGDDAASALGIRTEAARIGLLVVGAGLASIAVAVAGPVGFVALVVPHAARLLLGPLTGGVLVVAGLLGALLVLVSDLVGQHLFAPLSLPVGIVTAGVGAPYFLFLLARANRGV